MRIFLLVIVSCIFCTANAQVLVKKRIKRGRRNKSEHQLTLNKKVLEFDYEFGLETVNDSIATFVSPNLVIRYGLTEDLELNLELNPISTRQKLIAGKQTVFGFEPFLIGARYDLTDENKFLPEMALSVQLAFPHVATNFYRANFVAPIIQYTLQKNVNKHWVASGSVGVFYDGFVKQPNWQYDVSVSYNATSKWSLGADVFGFAANNQLPLNNLDFNVGYQFNKTFGIGAIAGLGISKPAHQSYFACNGTIALFPKKLADRSP